MRERRRYFARELGSFDEAEACFAEALAAEERLEAPAWCAYTRYEQAVLYLTRRGPGDETRAAALLAAARPVFMAIARPAPVMAIARVSDRMVSPTS